MPKNGKLNCANGNNNQEDFQWFENYEKRSKSNRLESLRNKDILNYIKDIEQNCRLEVSSGDEDYAGTKRSSNCSVRCSDTGFRSSKKIKSRVTSRKNKNLTSLEKKTKRSSGRNNMNAYNYCCSSEKSRFCSNLDLTIQENSRKNLNNSNKSTYQYPKLSSKRGSYKYRESSPRFYGLDSRKNSKTLPAVTEMTSLEVIKDWSQDAIPDSRINRSQIINRKTAKVRTFRSLRRRKFGDQAYMNIYPSITPSETARRRDPYYRIHKQKENTRRRELSEESDVNDFDNQEPLNTFYPGRNTADKLTALSRQNLSRNEEYKGRYNNECSYRLRRSKPQTSWGLRSNRLTIRAKPPETSSLRRISRWENEIGPPLKASSSIIEASIDRNYRQTRESRYKNNMNQRRRKSDILGERGSLCCCKPCLLRQPGKLCEVVRTREGKQWLDCCCENVERDETADCSRYCRCPENVNNLTWRNYRSYESARRPVGISKQINYTEDETALRDETRSKSMQLRSNKINRGESEFYLTMREKHLRNESATRTAFDKSDGVLDDVATENGDRFESEDLKPYVSFPDHRPPRDSITVAKKLSNGLKSNRGEAMEAPRVSRKRITRGHPSGKEFSFEIRTPRKLASGDSPRSRYEAAESVCECKEPFHDSPAACLTGSCTCIGSEDENAERNDGDSSREVSAACCCCCSSSSSSRDEDPVKKLESFCERVKAVNQNVFRKPSRSNIARRYFYGDGDERDQSEISVQTAAQTARSVATGWLTDPARLRLRRPRRSRGAANLEKILIYPPRGEDGPPLTLYKRSSNIDCRVKGDANTGFHYSVTYVQKFVSPTWMPSLSPEVPTRQTDEECDCSADYG